MVNGGVMGVSVAGNIRSTASCSDRGGRVSATDPERVMQSDHAVRKTSGGEHTDLVIVPRPPGPPSATRSNGAGANRAEKAKRGAAERKRKMTKSQGMPAEQRELFAAMLG
jgi:hypothetical protein